MVSRLGGDRFKDAPCMWLGHWTSTMPPHHLRSDCLHAIAAARLVARKPHHPLRPRA
jgi:hypothetical protein